MTSGIIEMLLEDTAIQEMVGQYAGKYKIYPVVIPQDDFNEIIAGKNTNYITVFKAQNDPIQSLTKDIESLLDYPRITVSCWSKNFRPTELMFEAVRNALDNVYGVTTDVGYEFNRIWLVDDRDGFEEKSNMYVHVSVYGVEVKREE